MEEIMKGFVKYTSDPYSAIEEWKEKNQKKVIGIFPMWLPEEIAHAAGMLPVVMWRSNEAITWGYAHVPPYNCPMNKSVVDDAVKGKLKFMDGMVFLRECLQSQEVPFIIENNMPPAFEEYLYMPPIYHASNADLEFTRGELERLRKSLGEFGGEEITDEKLNESIRIYNKNRSLLRRLYDIRRKKPGIMPARDILKVVWSSMLMLKEDHNKLLEALISRLENNGYEPVKGKKVFLSGCLCIHPQVELLDMIEDLGMIPVDDDIYVGYRYFANDAEITDDPIGALTERHFIKTPVDPARGEVEVNWGKELVDKVKRLNADGIVTLMTKYCPPHLCYYPDVKTVLADAGIPEVLVEIEHEIISYEGVKTRLQSFKEMLGGV